ncbi:MAG: calmodulin-binding protein [Planctomycetes bacterium]|nr:calmodulin-binding protein [Planctomycetota bacterium]MBL7038461.1 calmodulin-binding protein [Pirellulaceae bacterium]
MIRRAMLTLLAVSLFCISLWTSTAAAQERAYGRVWGGAYSQRDWERFYHYPYVFYPQNFWGHEYYRSSEDMYYRYPPEMRIPVYNRKWHNYFPNTRTYHSGHHFILDQL